MFIPIPPSDATFPISLTLRLPPVASPSALSRPPNRPVLLPVLLAANGVLAPAPGPPGVPLNVAAPGPVPEKPPPVVVSPAPPRAPKSPVVVGDSGPIDVGAVGAAATGPPTDVPPAGDAKLDSG